jgi:hypothetical protein
MVQARKFPWVSRSAPKQEKKNKKNSAAELLRRKNLKPEIKWKREGKKKNKEKAAQQDTLQVP